MYTMYLDKWISYVHVYWVAAVCICKNKR